MLKNTNDRKSVPTWRGGTNRKSQKRQKAIPDSKMPDLGWDATEELNTQDTPSITTENTEETAKTVQVLPETITAIAILIITFLETLRPQLQKKLQIGKNTVQAVLIATRTTSRNISRNSQRTANRNQANTTNRTTKQKLNDDSDGLYQLCHIPIPQDSDNQ